MRLLPGLAISTTLLLFAGCGGGDDALSDTRNNPNDFGGATNSINDFSQGSTGDSTNTSGLEANEVRITLEVPGSYAPDAELTRRNLKIVQPDRVSVYATNTALQHLGSIPVTTRTDASGNTIIAFDNGQPLAPDVIIEARFGNAVMRSLAADADRDVKINPFSEYLVRNTLPRYSEDEFQGILDCVNDTGGSLCLNKYVWSTLADQVHDFEIDIPANATVNSALELLGERGDFARYVAAMADYALLDEGSSGKISASSADYNSVFLGIELGQTFLESTLVDSGQWSVRTAQEERLEDANGVGYVYPALTLTSFDTFNIRVTSLASDIPYDRETLIHQEGNNFFFRGPGIWERNTHASSPGAATLLEDQRLLAGRALYQSITERDTRTLGWTRNPYYLDAYTSAPESDNTGPDRVVSGYFSAGKAIELESANGGLRRGDTLEDHYLSVLELDLLRQPGFNLDTLNGKDYNVVYLALLLGDGSTPVTLESGFGTWQISGNSVSQTQAVSQVFRDSSGAVASDDAGTLTQSWTLSQRTARLSSGDQNIGRLNLDVSTASGMFDQPDIGVGASTPDGSLLAFNLDDSGLGDGLLVAASQATASLPTSGRFRVQGIQLGMASDINRLTHFENAVLTLQSATSATLEPHNLEVVHSVSGESVSTPASQQPDNIALAYTGLGNGQVSLSAANLLLEGFYTQDQNQFFLRLRDTIGGEEQIGLVLATRIP
ncbi:hypothetical protein [Marinobacter qingdaonensis]|uniref:Lipoprotein n=1 Tax=Marinobacter qingdaonensis TaxID=3108486 RepID=A0ABU5P011_9GAMM|nr:hypothetical protein [Marinobacter sp. ASW11-75]MEA1081401.1 hypothetical protein [Marinobacter sp. ASW11-75]